MIAPRKDEAEVDASPPIEIGEETASFFRPGGRLQQACATAGLGFEPRKEQLEMAQAVAVALESRRHLAVEAGTGVGKSFAYLVPLLLAARARETQVLVSTYTIALQEQLVHKDIPFLQQQGGLAFRAVLVKGRSNYICLRRLSRAYHKQGELFPGAREAEIARLRAWADTTEDGSLQALPAQPAPEAWNAVCAEHGNCLGQKCREHKRCFLMKARAQMRAADLLVVNHHLFFSELTLREQGAAFLPDYDAVVLDEAHMVENVAADHLGIRLSHYSFEHWMRRLFSPDTSRGLLAALRAGEAAQQVTALWEAVDHLYREIGKWAKFDEAGVQQVVNAPLQVETRAPELLQRLNTTLDEIIRATEDEDLKQELRAVRLLGAGFMETLPAFLQQTMDDHVYWVEQEGRSRRQTVLHSAPIEVGPLLTDSLFGLGPSVVLTSATLAVRGRLDYFQQRIGATESAALCLGSPFNHERQMRLIIVENMPDPNAGDAFAEAVGRAVLRYVIPNKGRSFVLFTSAALLKRVAAQVREELAAHKLALLAQGEGLSRHAMLEEFRRDQGYVLFGLDSFWMGVDVRGEALSNVMIVRLPFEVPDQPVVQARMNRIRERGGDPFKDYALPEAILKFRQGVGRLIRTATDEGTVVVLDPRIANKWYGRHFLSSLPECPVEKVTL